MSLRAEGAAAPAAAAAVLLSLVSAVAAAALHLGAPPGGPHLRFADLVVGVAFPLSGWFVLRRDPANGAGRLLAAAAVVAFDPTLNELSWRALHAGTTGAAVRIALWTTNWLWTPYLLLPSLLVMLLPSGRLPSRRWRAPAAAVCLAAGVATLAAMLRPGGLDQIATADNPYGIGGASFLTPVMAGAAALALGPGSAIALGGLLVRQRRATGRERAQAQWLAAGAAAAATSFLAAVVAPWPLGEICLGVGLALLPAAIAVGAWRHGLFDTEVVLNRSVVSFALALTGLAVYALVVLEAGRSLAPATAAAVALAAAGAWRRAERLGNRLLFGVRDDPFEVVSHVGSQLDTTPDTGQALRALVETVHDALRLPYVAVTGAESIGDVVVGSPIAGVECFDCTAGRRRVATFEVGRRHRADLLQHERALLLDSARRAASLVNAALLVRELERSRSQIVAAREEERRRLRRDLHDGIASALAGIALQLDCLADTDEPAARAMLQQVRDGARSITAEVRALVDDLRPPALDELGLAGALSAQTANWAERMPRLRFAFSAEPLPHLPAGTEVAAYRVAAEAIANAARHSRATRCEVALTVEPPWLRIEIADDGRGFAGTSETGVGLHTMQERTAEAGGELAIESTVGGGTLVRVHLPLETA